VAAALLAAMVLAACGPAAPGIHLDAGLTAPDHVRLRWQGTDPGAAGAVVEFATEPRGQYAVLGFEPAGHDTLDHPDLMPGTTFYYRVRPYYGPASATVDVTLPPGAFDENAHADDPDWGAPRTRPAPGVATVSIHTAGQGAPTDLRATVMDPNGIRFTWTDHASDEDGYLVEVRAAGSAEFRVAAVLDPDINTYGLVTLPEEKRAAYRVRAFYYGAPSNIANQTTGHDNAG
jgi:hypothetical protein